MRKDIGAQILLPRGTFSLTLLILLRLPAGNVFPERQEKKTVCECFASVELNLAENNFGPYRFFVYRTTFATEPLPNATSVRCEREFFF